MEGQKVRAKLRDLFHWLDEYLDAALEAIARWDKRILETIRESRYLRKFYWVFRAATRVGDGYLWGSIGLFLMIFGSSSDRRHVLLALAVTAVNILVTHGLFKQAFRRARPSQRRRKIIGQYSFPSSHTATSFGIAFLIAHFYPVLTFQLLAYATASLIGFSRIYLGEHYPSDVLFGAALGTGVTIALLPLFKILFGV